jgi:two-component system sensor histidine kinase KdpD
VRAEEQEVLAGFASQLALARQGRRLAVEAAGASALAKANELRTALLAAVSHDLRTPLASIRAAATALLSSDVHYEPDAAKELLQTIDQEAERLNKLVGNLLDMSRLHTGALSLDLQPVGVEELVAAAAVGLPYAGTRLEIDVPETLPRVLVDPALTERAFANLIANALAFSPPESVVRVEGGAVGDRVDLRVVDNGPGIAAHDRARVFQPFQRLGDQPNGTGVGLGMAVAKGFIEAVGGELTIDDTPGGGTTMVVSLPVSR